VSADLMMAPLSSFSTWEGGREGGVAGGREGQREQKVSIREREETTGEQDGWREGGREGKESTFPPLTFSLSLPCRVCRR